jgi:hypothetical protein
LPELDVGRALHHGIDCGVYFDVIRKQPEHARAEAWVSNILAQRNPDARLPVQATATDADAG